MNHARRTLGTLALALSCATSASAQEPQLEQGQFAVSAERFLQVETAREQVAGSSDGDTRASKYEPLIKMTKGRAKAPPAAIASPSAVGRGVC
jgi:hypothetical protein